MTEQLYAVQDKHSGAILAVFSTEGQAMTHRAKLGKLDSIHVENPYIVVPLPVDTLGAQDPVYYAVYTTDSDNPSLTAEEILIGCAELATDLPEDDIDNTEGSGWITFTVNGWDRESVRTKMEATVGDYIERVRAADTGKRADV